MSRILAASMATAMLLTLPAGTALAADPEPQDQPAADSAAADASGDISRELESLDKVRLSAETRFVQAREESERITRKLERNQKRVKKARKVVSQYLRSIYMAGPTQLTTLASILDTDDPGDLMKRADEAERVGGHKSDQYTRAVALVKRTEESKAASDAALSAAKTSLNTVEEEMNRLQHQRARSVGDLAGKLRAAASDTSPKQMKRNSAAATAWADYLGQLAKLRVPPLTTKQLRRDKLPKNMKASKKQPGVAVYKSGKKRIVVLPERTISATTYAVSSLGNEYQWRTNTAKAVDCSSLVDRSWNVPVLDRADRSKKRELVPGGVVGLAKRTALMDASRREIGDLVFLKDAGAGVNHVGIAVSDDLMIAADAKSGGVNAVPINPDRVWKSGRLVLKSPKKANRVPTAVSKKKAFQCGVSPAAVISLPDGKILANPDNCDAVPGVLNEKNLQPATILVGRCAAKMWPSIQIIGGWRPADAYPDHPSGRAVDIMNPKGCSDDPKSVATGQAAADFFAKNADKFNVEYLIYRQQIWFGGSWQGMEDRGGCTANHMDHVHVTVRGPNVTPSSDNQNSDVQNSEDQSSDS